MSHPPFTAIIDSLPETVPFVGPETIERRTGIATRARIGANESGFGPSPRVIAALREAAPEVWTYPDPENYELRSALAAHLGIANDEVTISEGIDGLMGLLVRLFIAPGDVVVTSLGAYPTFNYHVTGFGGDLRFVPYSGVHENPEALAAKARETNARMVYLANPDNPMGSFWSAADIARFIDAVPENCLIVLDEAYMETAPEIPLALDTSRPNLLRLRTFSKAYGMAGLRCGYAIGHRRLVGAFNRIRNHFGVNKQAQVAALTALDDQTYLRWAVDAIADARLRIARIATENGLRALPSATNFVAIDCGRDGPYALAILEALAHEGVFVRKPAAPGLDQHIRISAGPPGILDILAEAMPIAVKNAQSAP
ncbi:pyridoxal phosphate-dependent aminotransferase [Devosia sp. XJ19-1]|uniref:Pyridoxal phosphate-dependent aminotransferase n=1 Tax=Devosia ureilytica TaxID=2952754 RepID=A0A9Q4ANR6_9HYPH|nr:pyridoxal phosphate-dependent aminotransferase [Devosia ureilytica]MCP8887174.1 pyridoxal phosphate-dependent aminotransferase [Devosia ureilytica]